MKNAFVVKFAAIAILSFAFGCSDKTTSSISIAPGAVAMLPRNCVFAMTSNYQSAAFEEFKKSALGKLAASGTGSNGEIPAGIPVSAQQAEFAKRFGKLGKSSLFIDAPRLFTQTAVCILAKNPAVKSADDIGGFIVSSVRPGINIATELNVIETELRAQGASVIRKEKNGEVLLALSYPSEQTSSESDSGTIGSQANDSAVNNEDLRPFFIASKNGVVAASTELAMVEQAVSGVGITDPLGTDPVYLERVKLLGNTDSPGNSAAEEIGQVYIASDELIENFVNKDKGINAPVAGPYGFFIGHARYQGTSEKGRLLLQALISPKNSSETSERLTKLVEAGGLSGSLSHLSSSVIDVSFAAKTLSNTMGSASPEMAAEISKFPKVSDATIGLALPRGASPFPDVYAVINSSEPAAVVTAIKTALNKQQLLAAWNTQTIAGTQVQLALSPLGIGAFLASTTDKVFLTTSQGAMEELLKGTTQTATTSGALFRLSLNGKRILDLVNAMQGTLAMFSGGKANIDLGKWQSLAQIGDSSCNIVASKEGIRVVGEVATGSWTR